MRIFFYNIWIIALLLMCSCDISEFKVAKDTDSAVVIDTSNPILVETESADSSTTSGIGTEPQDTTDIDSTSSSLDNPTDDTSSGVDTATGDSGISTSFDTDTPSDSGMDTGVWDTADTADTASTADTTDTPDTVNTADTADTADTPDTVNTADTADTADTPDTVNTADTADTPDTADTADTADTPDTADTADTADTGDTDPLAALCTGKTEPGLTLWQQFTVLNELSVKIDTSHCAFSSDPLYFTSIGGQSGHYALRGTSSIASETRDDFSITVRNGSNITPEKADSTSLEWYVNWMAVENNIVSPKLCTGKTSVGNTEWQTYSADGIFLDVDFSHCMFESTPMTFTSLSGSYHSDIRGAAALYPFQSEGNFDTNGFRVYINKNGITPEQANAWEWSINWMAVSPDVRSDTVCVGHTLQKETPWQFHSDTAVMTNVNTSFCDLGETPTYFTSLSGNSHHWTSTGGTAIYLPARDSFRIYLNGATLETAQNYNWYINWIKF
jgi:hypothetical protein